MVRFVFVLLSFLVIPACNSQGSWNLSLVQLIVTPEKYEGKKVITVGYLRGLKLYLNKANFELGDTASSIDVEDLTDDGAIAQFCEERYVSVRGRFVFQNGSYYLTDLIDVYDPLSNKKCWEKIKMEGE